MTTCEQHARVGIITYICMCVCTRLPYMIADDVDRGMRLLQVRIRAGETETAVRVNCVAMARVGG